LGTTKKAAGGAENFVKIDREYVPATVQALLPRQLTPTKSFRYVINAAKEARVSEKQRLVYLSVGMTL
jgi:hypothetical protein